VTPPQLLLLDDHGLLEDEAPLLVLLALLLK
jgi:hypothetical protein